MSFFIGLTVEEPINQMPSSGETDIDTRGKVWDSFHEKIFYF